MGEVALQDVALQAEAGEFALAGDFDEAGGFQFLHMVGQGGGCDGLTSANIGTGGSVFAGADLLQDLMASRIGQGLRDQVNLMLGKGFLFRHGGLGDCNRALLAGHIICISFE